MRSASPLIGLCNVSGVEPGVAAEAPLPIATGENLHTLYEFQKMIAGGGVSFPEPDMSNIGGMTGTPPDCTLNAIDLLAFANDPNLPGLDKNIVVLGARLEIPPEGFSCPPGWR